MWSEAARHLRLAFAGKGTGLTSLGRIHTRGWLGRVRINRQPNADLDAPPDVRYLRGLVCVSAYDPPATFALSQFDFCYIAHTATAVDITRDYQPKRRHRRRRLAT